jgi:phosphatidylglycerol---prolipoprotein diacylglyceryl transferase
VAHSPRVPATETGGGVSAGLTFPAFNPAALTIAAFDLLGFEIGPLDLRWYALGFLGAAIFGVWWMRRLLRTESLWAPGQPRPTAAQMEDFAFWALLAAIVGGRIGYIVFYMLPNEAMTARIIADPITLIRTWEGGLSFHGGFVGVLLAGLWFARKHKLPVLTFGDLLAAAIPIGIFLVRVANFINGELFGRHSDAPWAMRFPEGGYDWTTRAWVWLGTELPRHPSQLYEAALEGIALFVLIAVACFRFKSLQRPGLNIGIFLLGYAVFRFLLEFTRQPDQQMPDALQGYLTMGMLLSAPLAIAGAWLLRGAAHWKPA